MDKIKILFLQADTFYGADTRMHQLIMQYIDKEEFEIHCAIAPGTESAPSPVLQDLQTIPGLHLRPTSFGPTVHEQGRGKVIKNAITQGVPSLFSLASLTSYIRKHKIDIIHCKEKPREAFYGTLLAKATGVKTVIHLHVKVEDWLRGNVKWSMRQADGLIGVSKFVAESAIKAGYDPAKTYYAVNALDYRLWNPDIDGSSIRRELNIADDDIVMTIVAAICTWKGYPELIEAMPLIKKEIPNIKLLAVGLDEPRRDGTTVPLSPALKRRAEELGVQDNIIFMGFRTDVDKILAASDFFTLPSYEEPLGIAYLEAMAMKLPIIAINEGGGAVEIVEPGKMGLLSDYKNIEQLAENSITLARDKALRQRMGEYNRKCVVEKHQPSQFAEQTADIYRHMMGLGPTKQQVDFSPEAALVGKG